MRTGITDDIAQYQLLSTTHGIMAISEENFWLLDCQDNIIEKCHWKRSYKLETSDLQVAIPIPDPYDLSLFCA